ncbi:transmembrane gamma-carboxyglutamic acid protein 2 [Rhinoraja longicauda]
MVASSLRFLLLMVWALASPHHANARALTQRGDAAGEVFLDEDKAALFLGRKLLYNSWDFEFITQGDIERECYEEVCNFEEAHEAFENNEQALAFWNKYKQSQNPGSPTAHKFDVAGLVAGLIGGFILIILAGLVVVYFCKRTGKHRERPPTYRGHARDMSSPPAEGPGEAVPLTTLGGVAPALPTYDEALRRAGHHDAEPPPYARGSTQEQQPS